MQSTLTPQQTDPHDIFVIEPDVVLAARADHASPDPVQDALTRLAHQRANAPSEVSAGTPSPAVDTTFRAAAAVDATKAPGERSAIGRLAKNTFIAFLFALCSAIVATTWTHHGDAAKQMIANWMPAFLPASSSPAATPALAEQPDASPMQAATADQAPAQPARPSEGAAPAPAVSPTESTPSAQSMARDLATMGQQIEQLKVSIEQLKAGQAQMSRDLAKTSDPNPRPRIAALPPRPVAAPVRKPKPAFPASAASTLPPSAAPLAPPPALSQPVQQPQPTFQPDGEPVVRPPLPLH
jgi:hypothetical protein